MWVEYDEKHGSMGGPMLIVCHLSKNIERHTAHSIVSWSNPTVIYSKRHCGQCNHTYYSVALHIFQGVVHIIRERIPQVTEIPFVCIALGRCTSPIILFTQPYPTTQSRISGSFCLVLTIDFFWKLILCMGGVKAYQVGLFWHGYIWRYRWRRISSRDIT